MAVTNFVGCSSDPCRALAAILQTEVTSLKVWSKLFRSDTPEFWRTATEEEQAAWCRQEALDRVMWTKLPERLMSAEALLCETAGTSDPTVMGLRETLGSLMKGLENAHRLTAPLFRPSAT